MWGSGYEGGHGVGRIQEMAYRETHAGAGCRVGNTWMKAGRGETMEEQKERSLGRHLGSNIWITLQWAQEIQAHFHYLFFFSSKGITSMDLGFQQSCCI